MPYKSHRYLKRLLILVKKTLELSSHIDQKVTSRGRRYEKMKEVTTHRCVVQRMWPKDTVLEAITAQRATAERKRE